MSSVAGEIMPQTKNPIEYVDQVYLRLQSSRNLSLDLKKEFDGLRMALGKDELSSLQQEREELEKEKSEFEEKKEDLERENASLKDGCQELVIYIGIISEAIEMLTEVPDIHLREQIVGSVRHLAKLDIYDLNDNLNLPKSALDLLGRIRVMPISSR